MKKTLLLLTILLSISCFAQFSKTHYLPPITAQSNVVEDHYIYISTPNTKDVAFKIIENGGNVITGVVNNVTPFRYLIGTGDFTQLFTPKNTIGILKNKGFVIEAEDLVYANIRVNAARTNNGAYNHAGGLVSKGNSALGKTFRLGAMLNPLFDTTLLNFASILATENNTKVTISNLPIGTILTDGTVINGPITVTLNKNESYVLALENSNSSGTPSNSAKMIGALVESDKAVVVNSGSFCGSNSTVLVTNQNGQLQPVGRDVGFDQIVPIEKTGKEYIFVKGIGTDEIERVLLIANEDNTEVRIDGVTLFTTLNKGQYADINGSYFTNGNLYVSTTKNVSAYQSVAGSNSPANQNLFFVPPLNCATPNIVDNIPQIESIGNTTYRGSLNIITETGATVTINNSPISGLPVPVTGNINFVRYTVSNLIGNIAVKSTKQVYVSYFGTNSAATYGGYYSGFDTKPEIVTNKITTTNSACIPNVELKISTLSSYDTFQWYFNDDPIPGAISNSYTPTEPGYYQVKGSIVGCPSTVPIFSDKIPVSDCAKDDDNDGTNNNIDIDWDNDGLLNTVESSSNFFNHSNALSASNFSATVTGSGTITGYPVYGFVSDVPICKNNPTIYTINFTKPETIDFHYITDGNVQTTPTGDLANGDGDFVVSAPTNQTLTIKDPFGDLLIDTNYDGIYESGVKEFTSFEIRFRFKSTTAVTQGSARFTIQGYKVDSLTFKHYNLSDIVANRAAFYIGQTIDQDSDLDTIPDALDIDSDNDGIPDSIEAQGKGFKSFSGVDTNKDGLDDAFEPGLVAINSDSDINGTFYLVKDILDLDSDNDGIFDLVEAGHNAIDANKDGKVDGNVGLNGLLDILETAPDSGKLKYTIADSDADGNFNYFELDSDDDGCKDVIEAGFLDGDADGLLGNSPVTVNDKGIVTSGTGYTTPNVNYTLGAPIVITTQPSNTAVCELEDASFTIDAVAISTYQWEQTVDDTTWTTLTNNANYSGVNTATLTINNVTNSMNNYKYRVFLNRNGNSCGLYSATANLSINTLPVLNSPITLVQCDDDTDGISNFNLTEKNNAITADFATMTFTYFSTLNGATTNDNALLISNPLAYASGNSSVWARTKNANGCTSISQINLVVSTTQIPASFSRTISTCDDYIDATQGDTDGVANFDFTAVNTEILSLLPSPSTLYTITYYENEADALAEINKIPNPFNYRNSNSPYQQTIWVRIDSNQDNACYGLGPHIQLIVNAKPNIDTNEDHQDDQLVCSNLPTFFVQLDAGIQDATPTTNYTYVWTKDATVLNGQTGPTLDVNNEGTYTVTVTSVGGGCSRTRTISVVASDVAAITDIEIEELTDNNTIKIIVTGQGEYVYSLGDEFGFYQESNLFENVPTDIYKIFVKDKNGCGTVSKTIAVLGLPKFFTPNGDGINDYWKLKGASALFNSKAIIYIFDRYGKLLNQLNPAGIGWDGTFNNRPLPSDDYWYTIKLEDGREAKGHFALKR